MPDDVMNCATAWFTSHGIAPELPKTSGSALERSLQMPCQQSFKQALEEVPDSQSKGHPSGQFSNC